MTEYTILLKESGLKATFQRINILEGIEKNGHMSVDDIYKEVSKVHPSLSLATVYKNMLLMLQNGILVEVPIVGKKSKYELLKHDHMHLICTECEAVEDRNCLKSTDEILHEVADKKHFKLHKQQINLYGICERCQS
jgi:Fur family ferric uptake transcriptional regulator/Fur family peroxide stress response transcriptional regulator